MIVMARRVSEPTTYEAVIETADGRRIRIGFTWRKNYRGLLSLIQSNGRKILETLGLPEDTRVEKTRTGYRFPDGSEARFTGRTYRDVTLSEKSKANS